VSDLVSHHGAAPAGVVGPAEYSRLEESAVDDQLTPAVEQVEQAHLARGPLERIRRLHGRPRHPPALGCQGVTGARQSLFLHEQLLAGRLPLLRRHDRGCVHGRLSAFPTVLGCRSHGFETS
jgi:hypothetical protein